MLAEAFGREMFRLRGDNNLQTAFEAALRLVFRVLFVAYAEDTDILPYRRNADYAARSITELGQRLAVDPTWNATDYAGTELLMWLKELWSTINNGDHSKGVPTYNGGLFDDYKYDDPVCRLLAECRLRDAELSLALRALLVEPASGGNLACKVDFRGLSVRDFGTINEQMLAFALREAPYNLNAQREDVQEAPSSEVEYYEGDPVLLSLNAGRKEAGAYYTKQFAVDWILDHALTPALDEHLERVQAIYDSGDAERAGKALLDFSVVDPACGSGHFLVTACELIADRFVGFLEGCPLPYVTNQLAGLRGAAHEAMQHDPGGLDHLSDRKLIERVVASHCVYGVDINPLSAELARLSLWIRTFLPGLPLQALNGQIISGNLLVSACDTQRANACLDQIITSQGRLFKPAMTAAANAYETSRSNFQRDADEVRRVEHESDEAQEHLKPLRRQLDAALAVTLGYATPANAAKQKRRSAVNGPVVLEADNLEELSRIMETGQIVTDKRRSSAEFYPSNVSSGHPGRRIYDRLRALDESGRVPTHPQIEFPHVYSPNRPSGAAPGFDCVIGNPPWEKVKADKKVWWGQHLSGVRALGAADRKSREDALSADRLDLKKTSNGMWNVWG